MTGLKTHYKTGKVIDHTTNLSSKLTCEIWQMLLHEAPALLTLTPKQSLRLRRKMKAILKRNLINHSNSFYAALAESIFTPEGHLQHDNAIYHWCKKHLFSNSVVSLMYHLKPYLKDKVS